MLRNTIILVLGLMALGLGLNSCGASKRKPAEIPLYEVLTHQPDGGGNLHFYEILTQGKEIHMLLNDPHLKNKVKPDDAATCNFIVFNLGEQNTPGWQLKVLGARETADSIILTVEEVGPKNTQYDYMPDDVTFPYCVVRVNSKKNIVIE